MDPPLNRSPPASPPWGRRRRAPGRNPKWGIPPPRSGIFAGPGGNPSPSRPSEIRPSLYAEARLGLGSTGSRGMASATPQSRPKKEVSRLEGVEAVRRIAWFLIAGLAVAGIALGVWITSIDRVALRDTLASNLSKATGYPIQVRGPLRFRLLPHPGVSVSKVRVASPVHPSNNPLAKATQIDVEIDLLASLRQRILILGSVRIRDAEFWLERNEHGQENWIVPPPPTPNAPEGSSRFPVDPSPRNVELQNFKLHFNDAVSQRSLDLSSSQASAHQTADGQPIQLDIQGQLLQEPFHLSGTVTPLNEKKSGDVPLWRSDLRLNVAQGAAILEIQGVTGRIPDVDQLDLAVSLSSPEPAALVQRLAGPRAAVWAKVAGPIQLKCRVLGDEKDGLSLQEGVLELGNAEHLTLSVSGKIHNLIDAEGLELDLRMHSPNLGRALEPTGLGNEKLGESRLHATLRGNVDSPRAESLDLRLKSQRGVETHVQGELHVDGKAIQGELSVSVDAPDLQTLAETLSGLSPANATAIDAVLKQRGNRPLLGHILALTPVSVSARVKPSGNQWAFDQLDAKIGRTNGDWINVSGEAASIWPTRDGVEIRLRTHLHEPGQLPGLAKKPVAQIQSLKATGVFAQGKDLPAQIRDLDIEVQAVDRVHVHIGGSILLGDAGPRESGRLNFRLGGQTLAAVARTWGGSLPEWGPLAAQGQMVGSLQKLRLENLEVQVAKTHIAGSGELNRSTQIPEIKLSLRVKGLDLGEFQIGASHDGPPNRASSPQVDGKTDPSAESSARFSPEQFRWLTTSKGLLEIRAAKVVLDKTWTAQNLVGQVQWADGLLQGPDLTSTWPKGHLTLETIFDVRNPQPRASVALSSRGLHGATLAKWMGQPSVFTGDVETVIELTTHGVNLADVVSNMSGDLLLDIRDGGLASRYADAVALSLKSAPQTEFVAMTCFIGAMKIQAGVGHADPLLWDAPSKQVRAMGVVNFPNRTMDILLRPHLKDTIATAITAAVRIKGPFGRPEVTPEPFRTATDLARGLIGRTLGMVMNVSPQVSDAMAHLQASAEKALTSTGVDVPIVTELLRKPVSCQSVSADPRVETLRSFKPARSLLPSASDS
ncbi:MAG TPA: AsmA family protein [Myxococcales bacterium]|nr:AsmA family protein [Myxococcales bacterium]